MGHLRVKVVQCVIWSGKSNLWHLRGVKLTCLRMSMIWATVLSLFHSGLLCIPTWINTASVHIVKRRFYSHEKTLPLTLHLSLTTGKGSSLIQSLISLRYIPFFHYTPFNFVPSFRLHPCIVFLTAKLRGTEKLTR